MALDAEKVLDLYLDTKSPHAYLAVQPSLEADMKRRPATPAADRKARMYYTAARQHAVLQGLPFRTPYRLLDSASTNKAFLFAKRQGLEVPFLMRVYVQRWGNGWRDYEIESLKRLRGTLAEVGARTDGFEEFMAPNGAGEAEIVSRMAKAEAAAFTGVPHYVLNDASTGRELGLFGREHLALIREKFGAEGQARTPEVRLEFSHAWHGAPAKRYGKLVSTDEQ